MEISNTQKLNAILCDDENIQCHLEEQIKLVRHYMENMEKYWTSNNSWWDTFKKLKLSNKSELYISQVSSLIDEWIDNGRDAFNKQYNKKNDI